MRQGVDHCTVVGTHGLLQSQLVPWPACLDYEWLGFFVQDLNKMEQLPPTNLGQTHAMTLGSKLLLCSVLPCFPPQCTWSGVLVNWRPKFDLVVFRLYQCFRKRYRCPSSTNKKNAPTEFWQPLEVGTPQFLPLLLLLHPRWEKLPRLTTWKLKAKQPVSSHDHSNALVKEIASSPIWEKNMGNIKESFSNIFNQFEVLYAFQRLFLKLPWTNRKKRVFFICHLPGWPVPRPPAGAAARLSARGPRARGIEARHGEMCCFLVARPNKLINLQRLSTFNSWHDSDVESLSWLYKCLWSWKLFWETLELQKNLHHLCQTRGPSIRYDEIIWDLS